MYGICSHGLIAIAYTGMAHRGMAYIVMACIVMALLVLACAGFAYIVTAYIGMAYIVMTEGPDSNFGGWQKSLVSRILRPAFRSTTGPRRSPSACPEIKKTKSGARPRRR